MNWQDYQVRRCAIHVHTALDDGELPMEHVIVAARDSQVDTLLVTGHQHLRTEPIRDWNGYHDKVLVIAGTEVSTRHRDHFLAFGLFDRIAARRLDAPATLELIHKLGATCYVAHPQGRPWKYIGHLRYGWEHWDNPHYNGVEIWSYMHDWIEKLSLTRLPAMCREPDAFITGPRPEILAHWDRVAQHRHIAGIGALDTHGRQLPLKMGRYFAWARDGILPYRQNFSAFSTYLLCPRPSGEKEQDIPAVLKALAGGQGWACQDALHSGRAFRYYGTCKKKTHLPGSESMFEKDIRLHVELPCPGEARILCRGQTVASAEGTELVFDVTEPGEYRVEVDLEGKPWIRTNHIYLRKAGRGA